MAPSFDAPSFDPSFAPSFDNRMNDLPAVAFLAVKAYDYLASREE